jgi:hypothetical protein
MIDSTNSKKTTNLVDFVTFIKDKELCLYKSKLLQLEKQIVQDPNNMLYQRRYNFAKQRFEHLKNTAYKLRNLKLQLKNNNI